MPEFNNINSDFSVLIIEDNDKIRNEIYIKLEDIVKKINIANKVYVASNINGGLDIFIKQSADIVLTDIKMLVSEGIKFVNEIKLIKKWAQLIVMISSEEVNIFMETLEIGVDGYISKPITETALNECIKKSYELILLLKKVEEQGNFIQKLSCAVEQSPSSVIITDINGMIEYVNPKFTHLTGYLPEEVTGNNVSILKSGKTPLDIYQSLWDTIRKGDDWHGELINRKKNGELHWELVSISPVKNDENEITHFVAIKEDITEKKKAEEALMISEKTLRRRNNIIEQDLKNAQHIQDALLPREIPDLKRLKIDYRYLPLESVGGDYFSFTQFREGGMGVFLGDVTGHGVSAALFLALVKVFTDRVCRLYGKNPKKYFEVLNLELMDNMTTNFLTAVYGFFNFLDSDQAVNYTLSIGGHPPPMIYRALSGNVEMLSIHGTILGVIENIEYDEWTITLNKGDRLFLYTDGLHETMNSGNNIFGYDSLQKLILLSHTDSLGSTLDKILDGIDQYRGDAPVSDDIVLIGIEIV